MSDLISRADAIEAVRGLSVLVDDKDFSYFEEALNALPSADAEQVTGKLKNPCDSLLTEESNGSKEHKSKLELIRRADAVKAIRKCKFDSDMPSDWYRGMECAQNIVEELPSFESVHIENNTKPSDLVYRPSADAVHKPDYSYEADMVRRLKESLSAEMKGGD